MKNYAILLLSGLLLLYGCSAYLHQPMRVTTARIGEETAITDALRALPPPEEPIFAAVYKFRDQTGQYKPAEVGANWSTAITQGGTSILLKALETSGWFTIVERENVSNLLNERKIIRNSRMQYSTEENQGPLLPPLLFAGVILEGGIISYDANILTGGVGARYFGTGGSAKYRQDRVSVYLRAISTNNGKVLKTVYTSRTILSQAIDVGLFRFVSFQRLLEAETGFTYNEPSEIAVTEAIEKAVQMLIMEGIADSLWHADPAYILDTERSLEAYLQEKQTMTETNYLGRQVQPNTAIGSISAGYSQTRFQGDMPGFDWDQSVDLGMYWQASPWFSTGFDIHYSGLTPQLEQKLKLLGFDLAANFRLLPEDRFSPIARASFGVMRVTNNSEFTPPDVNHLRAQLALGAEFRLTPKFSLELTGAYTYLFSDNLDTRALGDYNDMFWQGRLGVRYYLTRSKLQ